MQKVVPFLLYEDLPTAVDFLKTAFGFRERTSPHDGGHNHAHVELELDDGSQIRLVSLPRPGYQSPRRIGSACMWIRIEVDDIKAHLAHAESARASIVRGLEERHAGEYAYEAADPEGHRWFFVETATTHAPTQPAIQEGT